MEGGPLFTFLLKGNKEGGPLSTFLPLNEKTFNFHLQPQRSAAAAAKQKE